MYINNTLIGRYDNTDATDQGHRAAWLLSNEGCGVWRIGV